MRKERPMLSSSSTIRTFFDAMGAIGKYKTERGAAEFTGHGHQVTAGKQRALARNRKAQAHAVLLERNGRLEQGPARLLAQAGAGIVDLHRDLAVGDLRRRPYIASGARGLRGVLQQVDQDALDQVLVRRGPGPVLIQPHLVMDFGMAGL